MAEENIEQIIKDHLKTLPDPVKDAIASFDWAREVFDIGRKHGMHVDRIADLQTEVMLVVIGLVSPRDFEIELNSRIERQEDKAVEIAEEVNEKVFLRIRNFMKDYYQKLEAGNKEDEIGSSDKSVLKKAGISLGDEEPAESQLPAPEQEVDVPPSQSRSENASPTAPAPTVASPAVKTLAPSQVFKSKTTEVSAEGKAKNFFDPYREPVE